MQNHDNNAQAALLIREADAIHPVGKRRFRARALAGAIVSMGLSIASNCVPYVVSVAVAHQLLDQGVVAQAVGATHLYEDITPTPAASLYRADAIHPLLQAGLDEEGFISKDRLFAAWSAAGIDEETATALVVRLWAAGAIIASPAGIPEDVSIHRFDADALSQLALPAAISITYDPSMPVPQWPQASAKYQDASQYMGFATLAAGHDHGVENVSPNQARERLARAVEQAGLASYSVPLDAMASPQAMHEHAKAIIGLNAELSRVSGWSGQVAGLGGRVHWVPSVQQTAVAQTGMAGGGVIIKGAASVYGHEFIHAIDYVISQVALVGNHKLPLSSDHGLLRIVQDSAIHDAHRDHLEQLDKSMPVFHSRVEAFRATSPFSFMPDENGMTDTLALTSPEEVIARSFEAYMAHQDQGGRGKGFLAQAALDRMFAAREYGLDYFYPEGGEVLAQSQTWSSWFASLKPLGLSEPYKAPPERVDAQASPGAIVCALSARRGIGVPVPPKGCAGP